MAVPSGQLAFDRGDLERLLGRVSAINLDSAGWSGCSMSWRRRLGSRGARRCSRVATWVQALCERLPASAVADARAVEVAADRFLGSSRVVALLPEREAGD